MSLLGKASLVMTPNAIKESKVYSIIPSNGNGDLTFTRATTATATLTNDAGLIENSPYNLLTLSESFDNVTAWGNQIGGTGVNATRTPNTVISPNGTLTADTIIFNRGVGNTSTDQSIIFQTATIFPNTDYTFSIWVKASTIGDVGKQVFIRCGGNGSQIPFTLTLNWVRIQVSTNITSVGTCYIGSRGTVTADNIVSVDLWGGQFNQGLTAKDYFFTTDRLNVPRLNYDTVGGCPSLLLEPQRTNLNLYSNNLENAYWTLYQATRTINSAVSPDGTTNAIKLTEDSTTNFHSIYLPTSITVTSGQTYSRSVYLKQAGRMWASLVITDNAITYRAWFDLQNGVLGTVGIGITAQITNVGNGWYKCTITRTAVATTFSSLAIEMASSNGVGFYLGNGTSGIYIYGAQLETGSYSTSYIPTTSATVTRNADQLTRSNIYTNGLITSAGGTWFVELNNNFSLLRDSGAFESLAIQTSTTTTTDAFVIRFPNTVSRLNILKRIATVETVLYTTLTDTVKIAIKWNGTTADVFVNGIKVVNATAFTTTILEGLVAKVFDAPKYIKGIYLFPSPLTDTECTNLTA